MNTLRCPQCNSPKYQRHPDEDRIFICSNCQAMFDDDPDDDESPYFSDPVKTAQSREEYQIREKRRKQKRRYR